MELGQPANRVTACFQVQSLHSVLLMDSGIARVHVHLLMEPHSRRSSPVGILHAGPVLGAKAKSQAAFSKPSSQETLFSVVPKGQPSGRNPEQACPLVSVLSIVRDAGSWGDGGRDFVDFIQVGNPIHSIWSGLASIVRIVPCWMPCSRSCMDSRGQKAYEALHRHSDSSPICLVQSPQPFHLSLLLQT